MSGVARAADVELIQGYLQGRRQAPHQIAEGMVERGPETGVRLEPEQECSVDAGTDVELHHQRAVSRPGEKELMTTGGELRADDRSLDLRLRVNLNQCPRSRTDADGGRRLDNRVERFGPGHLAVRCNGEGVVAGVEVGRRHVQDVASGHQTQVWRSGAA